MWVKRSNLQDLDLVEDFIDLLSVFEDDDKQEFMYVEAGESFIKRIL